MLLTFYQFSLHRNIYKSTHSQLNFYQNTLSFSLLWMISRTAGIEQHFVSHIDQRLNDEFLNAADDLFPDGFSSRDAARSFIEVCRYTVIASLCFHLLVLSFSYIIVLFQ